MTSSIRDGTGASTACGMAAGMRTTVPAVDHRRRRW